MSEKQYMAADLRGPLNVWQSSATAIATAMFGCPSPSGIAVVPRQEPQILAVNVASGVSQQIDLSPSGGFGPSGGSTGSWFGSSLYQEKFVRMIPESCGDTWYAWAAATGTQIDKNATGGATGVCAFLPSKVSTDELPAGRYLNLQPANSGIFRIWITNRMT
jgi:hypothetical protein